MTNKNWEEDFYKEFFYTHEYSDKDEKGIPHRKEEVYKAGCGEIKQFIKETIIKERKEILKEVMECVPEERKYLGSVEKNDIWREGFNSCRQTIINNINKL